MAALPVCSGEQTIRAFEKDGWTRARQRGSHVTLVKPGVREILTVPLHHELDRGLVRKLIRSAGLTVEGFIELL